MTSLEWRTIQQIIIKSLLKQSRTKLQESCKEKANPITHQTKVDVIAPTGAAPVAPVSAAPIGFHRPEVKADLDQKPLAMAMPETAPMDQVSEMNKRMGDSPACPTCGHITIRSGACYKCLNCGTQTGCS